MTNTDYLYIQDKDSGHARLASTNDEKRTQPMVWFVIGLSITVATGAIIYMNDDVRMALGKNFFFCLHLYDLDCMQFPWQSNYKIK